MSIQIKGIPELIAKLGRIGGRNTSLAAMRPPMQRAVYRLQATMQDYPPAPSGSRYIRGYGFPNRPTSEKLGQRWTTRIETSSNGLTGKVGNNASYGPWVQSIRFQTRWHRRTGWTTDERAIKENERAIVGDFERAIQAALK